MKDLLFTKNGDFKSGFLSKVTAGEFRFYPDRIVFQPMGWNRLFNNAPIIMEADTILSFSESFTVFGYALSVITKQGKYTFRFMGDKDIICKLMDGYVK
jgi:hypothetical protein